MITVFCACKDSEKEGQSPLDSMTDKEKAQYMSQKSDEYYAERMKTHLVAETKVSGKLGDAFMENTTKITENLMYDKSDPEDFNYITSSEVYSKSTVGGVTVTNEYEVTEAYSDDYYIYSYVTDDIAKNVYQYSVCTRKNFENYLEAQEYFGLSVNENEDFESVSVTKDEKFNAYILEYSEPTVSLMRRVNRYIAVSESGLIYDADLNAFSVIITVDAETMAMTSRVCNIEAKTLKNESYALTYELNIEENFVKSSNLDATPENLEQNYRLSDNLIFRQMAILEMKKLAASEDVSFDIKAGTYECFRMSPDIYPQRDKRETLTVNYGKRNGKFMYRLTDSTPLEILYNGTYTFVLDGEKKVSSNYTSEFDARSLIYSMAIQPLAFDANMISGADVEYNDGYYTAYMSPGPAYNEEFRARLGVGEEAFSVRIVAVFKGLASGNEFVSMRLEAIMDISDPYDYVCCGIEICNIAPADLQRAEEFE